MIYDFLSLTLALFLLMDSIGNIPVFLSLLKAFPKEKQQRIIFRELCIALGLLLLFFFLGTEILSFLHIEPPTVFLGGGIILFLIALRMLFPSDPKEEIAITDPLIVPLAIPLVAGPASLAAVMIYAKKGLMMSVVVGAILFAWGLSTCLLVYASSLQKMLGERGMRALERIMGFLLILLAIQMFLDGSTLYIHDLFSHLCKSN